MQIQVKVVKDLNFRDRTRIPKGAMVKLINYYRKNVVIEFGNRYYKTSVKNVSGIPIGLKPEKEI